MNFFQHAIALKIYSCVEKDIVKNRTDCFLFKLLTYFFMGVGPLWGMVRQPGPPRKATLRANGKKRIRTFVYIVIQNTGVKFQSFPMHSQSHLDRWEETT